jgi:CelD/BcsL family acetyltransferase involved in cellulose biosynthesis
MPAEWGFLASDWVPAWSDSYLPFARWRRPCRYLTLRDESGALTGVLPLATMQFGPLKFAAGAGHFLPCRGVALACDPEVLGPACATLADALADVIRPRVGLRLGPVAAHDPMCNSLARALQARGWAVATKVLGTSFVVELPQSVADFNNMCGGILKKANYYERRLRKTGTLEIAHHQGLAAEAWTKPLGEMAAIERNSWIPERHGSVVFDTPQAQGFWRRVLADDFLSASFRLWIMYLDGRPISFSCNLDAGKTTYILANLYDVAFKDHSCGSILARHVISGAIADGRKLIDWGQGDSGYKQRWGAKPGYAVHDLLALPPRPMARILKRLIDGRSGYQFR